MTTILEALNSGAAWLQKQGVESARLNLEHLLAHVLQCKRLDLYLDFEKPLTEAQLAPLRALMKRRGAGEPIQHLLGTVEFCGHEFKCDGRALIPRPETEYLVTLILKHAEENVPRAVLDMGCGSGCIGLSLALAWQAAGVEVTLADVSQEALDLARENRDGLHVSAETAPLVQSDLWKSLGEKRYDIIAANLPYIPSGEIAQLSREVRFDPMAALDGGADGLELVRRLLEGLNDHAHPGALLALELGQEQAAQTRAELEKIGWSRVDIQADLAGIERFVFARYRLE